MKKLLYLFKQQTQVKPVRPNNYDAGWMVVNCSPIEAFIDDCFRYGVRVAVYNLKVQLS